MGNSIQRMASQTAFHPPEPPTPIDPEYQSNHMMLRTKNCHQIPVLHLNGSRRTHLRPIYLLFSHGNATDLGASADYLSLIQKMTSTTVIGYDYLGYGESKISQVSKANENRDNTCTGSIGYGGCDEFFPSEDGCYQSIDCVYDYLVNQRNIKPEQIVLVGQSIGSGPTVDLASRKPVAGVILIAPFRTAAHVATDSSLADYVGFFDNQSKITKIDGPVLLIHGTRDETVPIKHSYHLDRLLQGKMIRDSNRSRRNYQAPLWVRGAGHNNLAWPKYWSQVINRINGFLEEFE